MTIENPPLDQLYLKFQPNHIEPCILPQSFGLQVTRPQKLKPLKNEKHFSYSFTIFTQGMNL